jgi:uncharacterized phiE125 gp8 family phage protein
MKTLYKTGQSAKVPSKGRQTEILTLPTGPIIPIADLKTYAKIDHTEEDMLIQGMLRAVTAKCENFCGRAFQEQKRRVYWSDFGTYGIIPYPPHTSVTAVQKKESDEWTDVSSYTLTGLNHYTITIDKTFNTSGIVGQEIRVDYLCGAEEVAEEIIHAVRDTFVFLYENRGELKAEDGSGLGEFELTAVSRSLLFNWRVYD